MSGSRLAPEAYLNPYVLALAPTAAAQPISGGGGSGGLLSVKSSTTASLAGLGHTSLRSFGSGMPFEHLSAALQTLLVRDQEAAPVPPPIRFTPVNAPAQRLPDEEQHEEPEQPQKAAGTEAAGTEVPAAATPAPPPLPHPTTPVQSDSLQAARAATAYMASQCLGGPRQIRWSRLG